MKNTVQQLTVSIILMVLVALLGSCNKNTINRNNSSIQGLWKITEFNYSDSANVVKTPASSGQPAVRIDTAYALHDVFDLTKETHTISFFEAPDNAYTSAMQAVYKIDYADNQLKDLVDTFYYSITEDVLAVIRKTTSKKIYSNLVRKPLLSIVPLGTYRYSYETPVGSAFILDASPFLNGTRCFYKLEKIN
jgi:hypothetical protein